MANFSNQPCEISDSNLETRRYGPWIWSIPDCPGELTALNSTNSASPPFPPLPPSPPRRKSTLLSFFSHTPQNIPKIKGGNTATHLRNNFQILGILTGMALGIGLEGMLWQTDVNCFLSKKIPSSLIKKHFRVSAEESLKPQPSIKIESYQSENWLKSMLLTSFIINFPITIDSKIDIEIIDNFTSEFGNACVELLWTSQGIFLQIRWRMPFLQGKCGHYTSNKDKEKPFHYKLDF